MHPQSCEGAGAVGLAGLCELTKELAGQRVGLVLTGSNIDRATLVLGCSTGNGLEHVNPEVTSRVAVVDLNPEYLLRLNEQFPHPGFVLDVQCADLADVVLEPEAFDLVHAALVLEYIEWPSLLPQVASTLKSGGVLSVVLQLPSTSTPPVTPSAFVRLQSLEPLFHFVEPGALIELARGEGLMLSNRRTEPVTTGKSFEVLRFVKHVVDSPIRTIGAFDSEITLCCK